MLRSVPSVSLDPTAERAISKAKWLLMPLILLFYLIAFVDRVNIGFAALTMNKDLGLTAYFYGWGAGIFFVSYVLFEVPSNWALVHVGARRWIARIMFSWGLASMLMASTRGPISFLVLRFLLGAAEAGFAPGIVYYIVSWFPAKELVALDRHAGSQTATFSRTRLRVTGFPDHDLWCARFCCCLNLAWYPKRRMAPATGKTRNSQM
jgi:MFS family permease